MSTEAEAKRPRRQTGENRRRLLEAGMVEFGLHGYHGSSTAVVAARAGVPQPHLYANFASKQQLFLVCVDIAVERACEAELHRAAPYEQHDRVSPSLEPADADSARGLLIPDADLRVLYQAFAAAADADLAESLATPLIALRDALGDELLASYLHHAALSLL